MALLGGLKAPIAEQFANDNSAASCSLPVSAVTSGKYVAGIAAPAATPCVITATFRSSGVSSKIQSQSVVITYTASTGIWACETSAPTEVAPKGCPHR
ncbi:pilin [Stenotrophomonas sp. PI_27]|nr:pilin [Stenotrophomonas sp. PI_27]